MPKYTRPISDEQRKNLENLAKDQERDLLMAFILESLVKEEKVDDSNSTSPS